MSVDKQVMGTLLSLNKEELNKTARYKFTASNDYGSSSVILIIETQCEYTGSLSLKSVCSIRLTYISDLISVIC